MGFDNYATNVAVNLFENGDLKDGFVEETYDYLIKVTKLEKGYSVLFKAYVSEIGWKQEEIIIHPITKELLDSIKIF